MGKQDSTPLNDSSNKSISNVTLSASERYKKVLSDEAMKCKSIKASIDFIDNYKTSDSADYSKAIEKYTEMISATHDTNATLDAKALEIIKYIGGGAGLMAIGTALQINEKNWPVALVLLIPIATAMVSIWLADKVRSCVPRVVGPSPRWFAKMSEHFTSQEIDQTVVKELDMTLAVESYVNKQKATSLRDSQRLAYFAICLLALPIIAGVINGAISPAFRQTVTPTSTAPSQASQSDRPTQPTSTFDGNKKHS